MTCESIANHLRGTCIYSTISLFITQYTGQNRGQSIILLAIVVHEIST